jgi:hypothetical protein
MKPHRIALVMIAVALAALLPATAGAASVKFRIGTHNTLRGRAEFKPFAAVIGWQEVETPAARAKMNRTLAPLGYKSFLPKPGPAKSVPISWRDELFVLRGHGSRLTHHGEAKVTPNRYVNWVVLQRRGTQERFAFVATHFISKAWTGHPERQGRWKRHARILRRVVANLRGQGLRVFVVGDFNRHRAIKIPGMVYSPAKGGGGVPLDQIYVSEGVRHSQSERLAKSGSDHFTYRARVAW